MIETPAVDVPSASKQFRSAGTPPTDSRIIPPPTVLSFSIIRRPSSCLQQLQRQQQLDAIRQWHEALAADCLLLSVTHIQVVEVFV